MLPGVAGGAQHLTRLAQPRRLELLTKALDNSGVPLFSEERVGVLAAITSAKQLQDAADADAVLAGWLADKMSTANMSEWAACPLSKGDCSCSARRGAWGAEAQR